MCGRVSGVIESSKEAEGKENKKIFSRKECLNWDLYGE